MPNPLDSDLLDADYLGDGVYALHDQFAIHLHTGSHDNPDQRIVLEPEVFKALVRYAQRIERRYGAVGHFLEQHIESLGESQ